MKRWRASSTSVLKSVAATDDQRGQSDLAKYLCVCAEMEANLRGWFSSGRWPRSLAEFRPYEQYQMASNFALLNVRERPVAVLGRLRRRPEVDAQRST